MKSRIISAVLYSAILLACYLLKIFVHALIFDALICAFAIIGTVEMVRAVGDRVTPTQRGIVYAFVAVNMPASALCEYFLGVGLHVTAVLFFVLAVALLSLFVIRNDDTTLESVGTSLFCAVYPSILLLTLILANHIGQDVSSHITNNHIGANNALSYLKMESELALAFIFVVSSLADVFAFFTGMSLRRKFPRKLAPKISPNKTIVGAIGGLVGGMISGVAVYFVYNWIAGVGYDNMQVWLPIFAGIGLLTAVATAFGDLVESCVKRRLGVKDMGKIMPGHGGIMDRLDGTMFASVVVYLCFVLIHVVAMRL